MTEAPANPAQERHMSKLTKARARVLSDLKRRGGKASDYDLGYPRSHMMHALFMDGAVEIEGPTNSWGAPAHDGFWTLTHAGRAALANGDEGK